MNRERLLITVAAVSAMALNLVNAIHAGYTTGPGTDGDYQRYARVIHSIDDRRPAGGAPTGAAAIERARGVVDGEPFERARGPSAGHAAVDAGAVERAATGSGLGG